MSESCIALCEECGFPVRVIFRDDGEIEKILAPCGHPRTKEDVVASDNTIEVHRSDLEKIRDTVVMASNHHMTRDASNAHLHMAEAVRYSPLTSELMAQVDRLNRILLP